MPIKSSTLTFAALLLFSMLSTHARATQLTAIEYHNGLSFPAISTPANARTHFCAPYERETISGQAELGIISNSNQRKSKSTSERSLYTPPGHFRIESIRRIETSRNGTTSYSTDLLAAGQKTLKTEEFETIYNEVNEYILSLDIPDVVQVDLGIKIDEFVRNYQSLAFNVESTHATVIHEATVWGRGRLTGKRSWYRGYIDVTVTCVPPQVTSTASLKETLINWVDSQEAVISASLSWTEWLDRDNESGSGDWELLGSFTEAQVCEAPVDIQARVKHSTQTFVPGDNTPHKLALFDASNGLACKNADQTVGRCDDYEIRFLCLK